MMGQLPPQQNELFYDFCLEKHIPKDHLLRQIDQFLDFEPFKEHLKPHYSHTGRPSIDPELMIRMLLVGYCYGIRSERRLCEEVNFNLAYRWFCKLGLEDEIPDHSSFSKNRHGRFRESDVLRMVFDSVIRRCSEEDLIKGEGFASDASYIKADASRQRMENGPVSWELSSDQSRAVKEYIEALDNDPTLRRTQKRVSVTDPMAQWSGEKGPGQFYYCTNYLIDIDHNIILDVEPTPAHRTMEVSSTRKMIDRVEQKHHIKPKRLLADTAYGAGPMLDWLVKDKNIEPHIPVWDKTNANQEVFTVNDFIWEPKENRYTCPAGKHLILGKRTKVTKDKTIIYRAKKSDCETCQIRASCTKGKDARKIARSIYEESRNVARTICKSPEYIQSQKDRKKVEVLFAHLKRIMNFDRLRLRGISGAQDEFILAATAQNLKKLAQLRFKPPNRRIGVPA